MFTNISNSHVQTRSLLQTTLSRDSIEAIRGLIENQLTHFLLLFDTFSYICCASGRFDTEFLNKDVLHFKVKRTSEKSKNMYNFIDRGVGAETSHSSHSSLDYLKAFISLQIIPSHNIYLHKFLSAGDNALAVDDTLCLHSLPHAALSCHLATLSDEINTQSKWEMKIFAEDIPFKW